MLNCSRVLIIATLLSVGVACNSRRHAAGFRLPGDGNAERGQQTFVEFGCYSCHGVSGLNLPRPTAPPPAPVVLGGEVDEKVSDTYLLMAMMDPSYRLASFPKDQTSRGGLRMPNFAEKMTVRQMVDVVTFLQSRYVVLPPSPNSVD
jgi:sulfur-oxidizing protein SoxX